MGPVQPVRQSKRIDRSKNIMEKAEERKKMVNLEIPKMKGIMSSNPFSILHVQDLDDRADKFGVYISEQIIDTSVVVVDPSSSSSMHVSSQDERQEELATQWIEVVRKSRGKHPKKKCQ
jgi:hypothetical protein